MDVPKTAELERGATRLSQYLQLQYLNRTNPEGSNPPYLKIGYTAIYTMDFEKEYKLRSCTPGDGEKLNLVATASFLEAYAGFLEGPDLLHFCKVEHSVEKYAHWLESPGYYLCLAEIKDSPVGYAVLCPPDLPVETTPDDIELKRIYLLHRFQKSGIGSALMLWSIEKARALGKKRLLLGVNEKNEKALAFYARHGFLKVGVRKFQVGNVLHDDDVLAKAF